MTPAPPAPHTLALPDSRAHVSLWDAGNGPPVLCLHGFHGLPAWQPWLGALSARFRVIAPQQPGFGDSTGAEHLDDFLGLALCYADLLAALKLDRVAIVGHDLGGAIACELSALYPRLVSKLVLVAPLGLWDDAHPVTDFFALTNPELVKLSWHDANAALERGAYRVPHTDEEKRADYLDRVKALSTAGKYLWPIPDKGLKKRLHRIQAPALLVWGTSDKIVPPSYATLFQRSLRDARVVEIPHAGHLPMLEQPERFLPPVQEFLSA